MAETFVCDHCGGTFEKARPEAEARAEAQELWSPDEMAREGEAIVCDPCFQKFMAWMAKHPEMRAT